jgi:hypothetical protein
MIIWENGIEATDVVETGHKNGRKKDRQHGSLYVLCPKAYCVRTYCRGLFALLFAVVRVGPVLLLTKSSSVRLKQYQPKNLTTSMEIYF